MAEASVLVASNPTHVGGETEAAAVSSGAVETREATLQAGARGGKPQQ